MGQNQESGGGKREPTSGPGAFTRRSARLLSLATLLLSAQLARPAEIVVDGICTLADAIAAANGDAAMGSCTSGAGADTIVLEQDVLVSSVVDVSDGFTGLPAVTSEITIRGDNHQIARDTSSPVPFRLFLIETNGRLVVDRVRVTGEEVSRAI